MSLVEETLNRENSLNTSVQIDSQGGLPMLSTEGHGLDSDGYC